MSSTLNRYKRNKLAHLFMSLTALIIFARSIIPFTQKYIPNYLVLSLMGIWIVLFLVSAKIKLNKFFVFVFVWIILTLSITLLTSNVRFAKNYVFEFVVFLFPLLVYNVDSNNFKILKTVTKLIIVFGLISSIYYIFIMISAESIYFGRDENGYVVSYTSLLFANIMFGKYLDKSSTKKIQYLVATLIFSISVVLMGFTIALLALATSLILQLIIFSIRNNRYRFLYSTIVVIVGGLVILNFRSITDELLNLFNNTIYYERISGVLNSLIYGDRNSIEYLARLDKYQISIQAFLRNPIFGTVWFHNDSTTILDIIGYHSFIFDLLALFGVFLGFGGLLIVLIPLLKTYKKSRYYYFAIVPILYSITVILLFNNQIPSLGIVIYYVMNSYFDSQNSINNTKRGIA